MPSPDVLAFVRAHLPPASARVLEVGAGDGDLARTLAAAGYDVVAIDPEPGSADVLAIPLAELDEPEVPFDAAVAVVSLHHVSPLEASCVRLAEVVAPGGTLIVDEFDVELFDERAAEWWLEQRRALGGQEERTASEVIEFIRAEVHPLSRVQAALEAHFELGPVQRCSYLYRWSLAESLRPAEEELIAAGDLPAVGARLVGLRRP
jgi:SAM-dependent methyltransferase